jgi:hypothetical protein
VSLAIDANVLLYASDDGSPYRDRAMHALERAATGSTIVYLFWPVLMAYLRVATHPSVFGRPVSPLQARENIGSLVDRPHVVTPGEQEGFWSVFEQVATEADVRGTLVPDAHLVALMVQHGVTTLWSNDRDYRRFPQIDVVDPLEGPL